MAGTRRLAAPTAQPAQDGTVPELRADPHGLQWTRGAPPIDLKTYPTPTNQDVVADSTSRGTGGRRASGFRLLGGGTVTITTGAGQTDNYNGASLPAGYAETIEFTKITSSDAVGVVVFW
jgi:hypothetical protein